MLLINALDTRTGLKMSSLSGPRADGKEVWLRVSEVFQELSRGELMSVYVHHTGESGDGMLRERQKGLLLLDEERFGKVPQLGRREGSLEWPRWGVREVGEGRDTEEGHKMDGDDTDEEARQ